MVELLCRLSSLRAGRMRAIRRAADRDAAAVGGADVRRQLRAKEIPQRSAGRSSFNGDARSGGINDDREREP